MVQLAQPVSVALLGSLLRAKVEHFVVVYFVVEGRCASSDGGVVFAFGGFGALPLGEDLAPTSGIAIAVAMILNDIANSVADSNGAVTVKVQ